MKTQIKLYPAALMSLSPRSKCIASKAGVGEGGRGGTAWAPATATALSCRNTNLQWSQVQAHTREMGCFGGHSFCFPPGHTALPGFSSAEEATCSDSTLVVSLLTPRKAKIQAPVFLLWEEPKVSDIPRKPVGKCCVSQSKYGASEDYQ